MHETYMARFLILWPTVYSMSNSQSKRRAPVNCHFAQIPLIIPRSTASAQTQSGAVCNMENMSSSLSPASIWAAHLNIQLRINTKNYILS